MKKDAGRTGSPVFPCGKRLCGPIQRKTAAGIPPSRTRHPGHLALVVQAHRIPSSRVENTLRRSRWQASPYPVSLRGGGQDAAEPSTSPARKSSLPCTRLRLTGLPTPRPPSPSTGTTLFPHESAASRTEGGPFPPPLPAFPTPPGRRNRQNRPPLPALRHGQKKKPRPFQRSRFLSYFRQKAVRRSLTARRPGGPSHGWGPAVGGIAGPLSCLDGSTPLRRGASAAP